MKYVQYVVALGVLIGILGCDSGGTSTSDEGPTAAFNYSPAEPTAGEVVTFNDASTHPADVEIVEHIWDFEGEEATGTSVTHTFLETTNYRVELTVTDASGNSDSEARTVQVAYDGPTYQNPVATPVAADPTVIRAPDGTYYLYATQDDWGDGEGDRYLPIFKSDDLKDWTYDGEVFSGIPDWGNEYDADHLWAPDITERDGTFYLYYSWVGFPNPCIGVATAEHPSGPWEDSGGPVFCSEEIGVDNSIDPFVWETDSHPVMVWGSFNGIYAVDLNEEGTAPDGEPVQVADGRFEGAYVHEHDDYKYLFVSAGSCCEGAESTYEVQVGRSRSITGPYVGPYGTDLRNGGGLLILDEGNGWVGPGHNSVATDDAGQDWIVYHAIPREDPRVPSGANRRPALVDRIKWEGGWPEINGGVPSESPQPAPVIE